MMKMMDTTEAAKKKYRLLRTASHTFPRTVNSPDLQLSYPGRMK
jgi:hypothetical protein